jgi:hypothetical protein
MSYDEESDAGGDAEYEVGNKRPPKHSQFKPGTSGNPTGRPKGSSNFRTRISRQLRQMATVNSNGRTVKMRKDDLVARQLVDLATKGNLKATQIIARLDDEATMARATAEAKDSFEMPSWENLRSLFRRLKKQVEEDE